MFYLWTYLQTIGPRLFKRDEGATMVEYGLLVALIAVVVMAALWVLGPAIADLFTGVAGELD